MIDFGGVNYYIDMSALDKLISPDDSFKSQDVTEKSIEKTKDKDGNEVIKETIKTYPKGKEIDGALYDTIRLFIEIVTTSPDEMDDTLGAERAMAGQPLNYKIAFNTLIHHGILVAVDA